MKFLTIFLLLILVAGPAQPQDYSLVLLHKKIDADLLSEIVITSYSIHYTKLYEIDLSILAHEGIPANDTVVEVDGVTGELIGVFRNNFV